MAGYFYRCLYVEALRGRCIQPPYKLRGMESDSPRCPPPLTGIFSLIHTLKPAQGGGLGFELKKSQTPL